MTFVLITRYASSTVVVERPVALLINPPVYDFALFDLFHKPLGLMRIGRWLERNGYSVHMVDALDINDERSAKSLGKPVRRPDGTGKFFRQPVALPPHVSGVERRYARYGIIDESLKRRLSEIHPDVVLITSGMTYWYPGVVEVSRLVKALYPKTPVLIGGVYASLLPDHCTAHTEADLVVSGPAETVLSDTLASFGLPSLTGIPGYEVLPLSEVWRGAGVIRLNSGCPLKCDYCASRLLCSRFKSGDPTAAFSAMSSLCEDCGVSTFAFYDDALLFEKEKALLPLLESIIDSPSKFALYTPNGLHIRWLDSPTAHLMKQSGFMEVRLGLESSSEEFHASHDNKTDVGNFQDAVESLRSAGFNGNQIVTYVLAGLPGQRVEEVEESIRFVSSAGAAASVAEYSPVPGTSLWSKSVTVSSFPIGEEPIYQSNSVFPMAWDGFTTKDLQRLKELSRELRPAT